MRSGWVHELTDLTMVRWSSRRWNTIQAITSSTGTHTHGGHANIYCAVLYSNLWQRRDYLHMHPIQTRKKNSNASQKGRSHTVRDKSTDVFVCVCVCVCACVRVGRMNFPLSQQGLNTHRANIIGLNPGRVDIGLVWVRDFIFLSLTLVFAGCDLNSIGVICLSKARTGTRRSWVCVHWNQGNSIRRHPYCVWGWDSSVDLEGLGLGDSTSGDCTISRERVHNGWGETSQMNAFKNALSAHPGNRPKACFKCFISSCGSSLYRMASVSSPAPQVSRASFQGTNNVLFLLRPITLPFLHERDPDTKPACQNTTFWSFAACWNQSKNTGIYQRCHNKCNFEILW